ncbi:colicin E3/pyocin S6 family cytotoxin [Pseudomonas sp. CLCA07]
MRQGRSCPGAIEVYDKQGKHIGEVNHETGEQIDPAVLG